MAEVNQEHTVYLVEVEDENELARWLARHHRDLFEEELKGWYTDPTLWPRDRSLKILQQWCSFELHTVVIDTVSLRSRTTNSKDELRRLTRNLAD